MRRAGRGTITLSSESERPLKRHWEADINRYYYACGCASGARGLLQMLMLGVGVSVIAYLFDAVSVRQLIGIPIVAAIAGAGIGKITGLARAHRRLVRVVHTVQAHWKPKDREERPIITCG